MIADGMLEKVEDYQYDGQLIPASRLGYRITAKFVRSYMARVFDNPDKVFSDEILRPEQQDPASFADGVLYIAEAQKRVAELYLVDGGYELACPPLQAILNIMANGNHQGLTIDDPKIREMFTCDSLLGSDWYRRRLAQKKYRDTEHWKGFVERLSSFQSTDGSGSVDLNARLEYAKSMLAAAESDGYEESLVGTLGADPMRPSTTDVSLVDRLASV